MKRLIYLFCLFLFGTTILSAQWGVVLTPKRVVAATGIAFVNSVTQGSPNGNTFTTTAVSMSGGNFFVVAIAYLDFGAPPTLTDTSVNTWRTAPPTLRSAGSTRLAVYYAYNATCTASHQFIVTGLNNFASITVFCFRGVRSGSDPYDVEAGGVVGSGNNTAQAGPLTPTNSNSLFITAITENKEFPSVTAPFGTPVGTTDDGSNHSGVFMTYEIQTAITARDPLWSWTTVSNPFIENVVFNAP